MLLYTHSIVLGKMYTENISNSVSHRRWQTVWACEKLALGEAKKWIIVFIAILSIWICGEKDV